MKNKKIIELGRENTLTIDICKDIANAVKPIEISKAGLLAMKKSKEFHDEVVESRELIYGVSTQFGNNVNLIDSHLDGSQSDYYQSLDSRQLNLVKSHACGLGSELPIEVVRLAMALRAHCLGLGYSGAGSSTVEQLVYFLNKKITPVSHRYGSIGASGDLIPLASIAAALCGEKVNVNFEGKKIKADVLLKKLGKDKLRLEAKQGLALINGTSMMTSMAALAMSDLKNTFYNMLSAVAMSLEAMVIFEGAYDPKVHVLKNHQGSIDVNQYLLDFWKGSEFIFGEKERNAIYERLENDPEKRSSAKNLQDYYSLRSVAQGFGTFKENLDLAIRWVEEEMNSVNDNPIVDFEERKIYHAANFMGYYITEASDILKMDIAQASTWLHALLADMVHPRKNFGLPTNIINNPEEFNGFRPLQILMASIAVQNRKLAQSHQAYMLPTEGDNQDVNSLGNHAAYDLMESVDNLSRLTSIMLLAACQALDLRGMHAAGERSKEISKKIRKISSFIKEDRLMADEINKVALLVKSELL